MRLLLRLPADSLLPGHTPAQEVNCEAFWKTLMSSPNSAIITAASVQSTPGISCNKVSCAAYGLSFSWMRCSKKARSFSAVSSRSSCNFNRKRWCSSSFPSRASSSCGIFFRRSPLAKSAISCALAFPAIMARSISRPETPKTSVATLANLMLALSSSFSRRLRSVA